MILTTLEWCSTRYRVSATSLSVHVRHSLVVASCWQAVEANFKHVDELATVWCQVFIGRHSFEVTSALLSLGLVAVR